ncbi:MAG: DUF447 family protein [Methanolinea sp.]|nr:DUF447 family protein [Methanolinea sp.]
MGLLRDGINEVIATTSGNAAPMGIIRDGERYSMVVYLGSHTAGNIGRFGWVVANIIHDPVLYVKTAFSDIGPEWFREERAGALTVQRLNGAEAWCAFRAKVARRTKEASLVELEPLREEVIRCEIHPVNRGFSSIIEATIHATRIVRSPSPKLAELISHHAAIVRRCGGREEKEALALLEEILKEKAGTGIS